ncbi:hypothetical protein D3C59_36880 [Streptomyces sp. SHP22-7]|nr:hypothetical protein D3C59_36880 [Streptomyces sp. SHP22-7]
MAFTGEGRQPVAERCEGVGVVDLVLAAFAALVVLADALVDDDQIGGDELEVADAQAASSEARPRM